MLELTDIGLQSGRKTLLKDVSFTAEAKRITALVGPRGSGKTELVRVIMGLIDADSGEVSLEGTALGFGDRQNFGYLPDERGGYPGMKVLEQIVFFARLHGMTLGAAERNAVTLLKRLGLSDRAYAPLSNLSGTEASLVDIAAVLAADPDVVVLDDPFSGLDVDGVRAVFGLLRDHAASGVPVLVATEDWGHAQEVADDLVVLDHGAVVAQGSVAELRAEAAELRYRLDFADAAAAQAAAESLRGAPGVEDSTDAVTVTADRIVLRVADEDAVTPAITSASGLRGFGREVPGLAEIFKERV
ncbi:ABC transporter ATP-binding protein [Brevibacterium litoralis]|uniref:ABC transporter ATP-binding protein n=1 Tax=Brevibacterium litoralis TaxID=3138935 RepID=UPI0032EB2D08